MSRKGFVSWDIVELPDSKAHTSEAFFTIQDHKMETENIENSDIIYIRTECDMYVSLRAYDEGNLPIYTFPVEIYVDRAEVGPYMDYSYHVYQYLKSLFHCNYNIYY